MKINNSNRLKTKLSVLALLIVLTGCEDRTMLAKKKMQDIRNRPSQPIKPPPNPEKIQEFTYNASNLRSPFMPTSLMVQASQEQKVKGVRRNDKRIKQPLEQFELNQLLYKGTIGSPSGVLYGLIQTPDGQVASVKVGNYLGKNDGRITKITPNQIDLIEIVPDSRVGYVEKPATITAASY